MQDYLEVNATAQLRVYAIWLPMLGGDQRATWDSTVLPDPRVIHLWDADRLAGRWFAENVDGYQGVSWDAYYLYGLAAEWQSTPGPPLSIGSSVFGRREELTAALAPLFSH